MKQPVVGMGEKKEIQKRKLKTIIWYERFRFLSEADRESQRMLSKIWLLFNVTNDK